MDPPKFCRESLKDLESITERVVVIVCDGSNGRSASLLGLSDEFVQHSCRAYGAVAALERHDQASVPTPEIRVHNLTFDLNAYGNDCDNDPYPQGFHLKIFGSARHRYISLAVPRGESKLVKTLKGILDQSIMRNVFQACFNSYKQENESPLSDKAILKHMKFSPRLFEIKVSHRMESVAYIEDANLFVVTEGESARCVNFHSGMDVNLGFRGVQSLETFIRLAASAETEKTLLAALNYKFAHVRAVTHDFIKNGLKEYMYT
ncbi:hypothetical protein CAPTEDRAFT_195875 [Capitella teleta]|uniref:Uncharacterized protein n=1 Tax=Capitella teleta TaxID=283909 RepID=R7TD19_CAPTE|nr:hypothetical protein CAPTEDRAFT_195875 [Capitella teleta]|eukprot:ELT88966.1 hypothetical protein CAPTEDRAFT_195875 [Capitella teleta]